MTAGEMKHQAYLERWKERIMECRGSGQRVSEWCQEHGISESTYYRWEREIFGRIPRKGRQETGLVPVKTEFAEVVRTQPATADGRVVMTVRQDTVSVDIYEGAEESTVAAICRALGLC